MKHFVLSLCTFAALTLCVTSCKDVTHVQVGYISDRDECHSRADYGVSTYSSGGGGLTGKDKSSMLTQLFCECMKEREWSVAGCKYKDTAKTAIAAAPAQQQPTIVVVQAPPAAAVAAPAQPEACPIPPKGKKRPKRRLDGTCPAPEEAAQSELDNVLNHQ